MGKRSFTIITFGCQMNKLDSELIASELLQAGYTLVDQPAQADIILFNACSVRRHAEERVYSRLALLKGLKSRKPDLIIGLVGCMAEMQKANALKRIPYLNLICGPHQHKRLPYLIDEIQAGYLPTAPAGQAGRTIILTGPTDSDPECFRGVCYRPPQVLKNQVSAYVSAMRGCNNFCSYCVVPYLRGREISRPINDIVKETHHLAQSGCKEITLLGQNIASYGKSLNNRANLVRLLEALHNLEGIQRIRFITSHPAYVTDELLKAMSDLPKVCEHLHMPAQSGSNKILKAMNRPYTAEDYLAKIDKARAIAPQSSPVEFSSDFIVGFPGETDADFQATVDLVRKARFLNSFVFKYSVRPGTKAAQLKDDVPLAVKKERNNLLLNVQSEISRQKNQALIGQVMEILVEGKSRTNPEKLSGRTRQNHIVNFSSGEDLSGKLVKVKITSATNLSLQGVLYR